MNGVPGWVGPTMAISLAIIALSFMTMGAVAVLLALGIKKKVQGASAQLAKIKADAEKAVARARAELEGYASLSKEGRDRIRGAMDAVDQRLTDLDALVDVLQSEVEETALDAAAFMRTVRGSGKMLGAAKSAFLRRRRK